MDAEEFIEHFGKKGMRWGVSNSAKQRNLRAKGMGPRQLKSEAQRVAELGGGMKGTLALRKQMLESGELSKEDAHKGTVRFGRNLALALLGGAAVGGGIGRIAVKTLGLGN